MNALRDGIRRVNDAPAILFGVWLLMLGISLPLDLAAHGLDTPYGFDVLTGVGGWPMALVTATGAAHIVGVSRLAVWLFLAGGIMDRYARDRPTRSDGFFAATGVFFFRFLRLAIVVGIVYAPVYWIRRRLPVELSVWILFVPFALAKLISEYAAVRSVVEDRRSMINSIAAAARFILANAGAVVMIYLATRALSAIAVPIYIGTQPAPDGTALAIWSRFVAAQLFALWGIWVTLVGWASEVSLFQSRLAHAGYVARAQPVWPESPSAEALRRS